MPTDQQIRSRTAAKTVGPPHYACEGNHGVAPAAKAVPTTSAIQEVDPTAATQPVVSGTSVNVITTTSPEDDVIACRAGQRVRLIGPDDGCWLTEAQSARHDR